MNADISSGISVSTSVAVGSDATSNHWWYGSAFSDFTSYGTGRLSPTGNVSCTSIACNDTSNIAVASGNSISASGDITMENGSIYADTGSGDISVTATGNMALTGTSLRPNGGAGDLSISGLVSTTIDGCILWIISGGKTSIGSTALLTVANMSWSGAGAGHITAAVAVVFDSASLDTTNDLSVGAGGWLFKNASRKDGGVLLWDATANNADITYQDQSFDNTNGETIRITVGEAQFKHLYNNPPNFPIESNVVNAVDYGPGDIYTGTASGGSSGGSRIFTGM